MLALRPYRVQPQALRTILEITLVNYHFLLHLRLQRKVQVQGAEMIQKKEAVFKRVKYFLNLVTIYGRCVLYIMYVLYIYTYVDSCEQDQLVMQMIAVMDSLLKDVNLDLQLLTYGILATGQRDGNKKVYYI